MIIVISTYALSFLAKLSHFNSSTLPQPTSHDLLANQETLTAPSALRPWLAQQQMLIWERGNGAQQEWPGIWMTEEMAMTMRVPLPFLPLRTFVKDSLKVVSESG